MNTARGTAALIANIGLAAGLALAWAHPLWPGTLLVVFAALTCLFAWRRDLWLFALPALLPIASAAPWTGWQMFDEFDLLLLAALAGLYARRAWQHSPAPIWPKGRMGMALALFATAWMIGVLRGLLDTGSGDWTAWADYLSPANTLRVGKSTLFALLLWPMLAESLQHNPARALRHLTAGITIGLSLVALAVLHERWLFPGLFEFSEPYRTTAWFWEMHVGGAALDGYLVLTTPFALWAALNARRPLTWALAAGLALLFAYACLTTFARGVLLGASIALFVCGYFRLRQRLPGAGAAIARLLAWLAGIALLTAMLGTGFALGGSVGLLGAAALAIGLIAWRKRAEWGGDWRHWAGGVLLLALSIEVVGVLYGGSFMFERLTASNRDFGQRLEHWRHGVSTLGGPTDWLLGKGIGRLPAHYTASGRFGELPGRAEPASDNDGSAYLRLAGPTSRFGLGGLFALTQRVTIDPGQPWQLDLQARAEHASALYVEVCERHLLYAGTCRGQIQAVPASDGRWLPIQAQLDDEGNSGDRWSAARPQVLALTVLTPGTTVEIDAIELQAGKSGNSIANGHFADGLAGWLPLAQYYFLPWHIDNFILEILIERGLLALAAFAALLLPVWRRLGQGEAAHHPFAPYLLAALLAYPALGMVSSLLDVPRVAWLFQLLALVAATLPARTETSA